MSLFGFGKSSQTSSSQSSSSSLERSIAEAFGIGSSAGENFSSQSVFAGDVFQELFQKSANVAGSIATGGLTAAANGLFDSGTDILSQLGGMIDSGPQGAGEQYLAGRLNDPGTVQQQIAALEADLGQFFGEQVLPGIRGDAIAAGGLNGNRYQVAEGMAADAVLRQFMQGATGIRANDQASRDAIASTLASSTGARRLSAATTALNALPAQLGLVESGNLAALQPLIALASILGGPTVLTDSYGYDTSSEESGSRSESFATSSSQSTSSAKGKSFDVNLGWGS